MKLSVSIFAKKAFAFRYSLQLFLLLALSLIFSGTSAKTIVIGNGSGMVSQTSMSGLSAGDVIAIVPGTYDGATFSDLNNVSIINNGGVVNFTGTVTFGEGLQNVTMSGTGTSGATYGFQFSNLSGSAFVFSGTSTRGMRIYNCSFNNVSGNVFDASGYYTKYNGDTSTLKLYRTSIANISVNKCGLVLQGSWGIPNDLSDVIDSISIANVIVAQTAANGQEIAAIAYRVNIHDWNITYDGANPIAGDCGEFVIYGNGRLYNVYSHGGRGYLARWWNVGLNGAANSYIYNNIDLATNAYGFIDTRNDPNMFTGSSAPYTTGGNIYIWNNVSGNKTDVNGYIAPLAVIGSFSGYTCEVKNNLGFNTVNGGGSTGIIQDNSSGTWTADSSNNRYYTASQILSVLTDTINCNLKAGASGLIDAGTGSGQIGSTVTFDIAGNLRPQGNGYDIGAREYSGNGTSSVTANAGSNQTISLPANSVSVSASASTVVNSTIISYEWSQHSGPNTATLSSPTSVTTTATGLIQGTYVFSVNVKDAKNDSSTATVTITVAPANQAPTISVGSNQTITLPTNSVTLTGTVTDILGISSYLWTQASGPNTATISSSGSLSTSVTGLIAGTYVFQLQAIDILNLSAVASVTITVNSAPVPGAAVTVTATASPQSITLPANSITLTATVSDPSISSPPFTTWWSQLSGPNKADIKDQPNAVTDVTGLIAGTYVFYVSITDENGSATNTVTVDVNEGDQAPTVSAGSNQTITLPTNSVTLTGTVTDILGISSYLWTQASGPNTAAISSSGSLSTSVTGLIAGTYVFQLQAIDILNLSAVASVTITVNSAPVPGAAVTVTATASPESITLPANSITLTAKVSDPNISSPPFTTWWSQLSGPNKADIKDQPNAVTDVTGLIAGTYVFFVSITDENGSATNKVTVNVNAASTFAIINQYQAAPTDAIDPPPVANAGNDTTILSSAGNVILNGSASTSPAEANYHWAQINGINATAITSADSVATNITGLSAGVYAYTLTITDKHGNTSTDTVRINVTDKINEASGHGISVYPNPTSGNLNLQVSSNTTGIMWVFVYDMTGAIAFMHQYNKSSENISESLDLSSLLQGTYTLQTIIDNKTRMVTKFVKQ